MRRPRPVALSRSASRSCLRTRQRSWMLTSPKMYRPLSRAIANLSGSAFSNQPRQYLAPAQQPPFHAPTRTTHVVILVLIARPQEPPMRQTVLAGTAFFSLFLVAAFSQTYDSSTQTMRPVIRGRHAAVASMKAEATEAARRILDAGGNAFDAAVAGQAALGVTDFSLNGVGSDAVLLVYNSRDKKVYSINAEPRAPKLATIEWYDKNNGGKIPESDGLLSGGIPGVVDAWYILLDRWGTMSFEQVLQPA